MENFDVLFNDIIAKTRATFDGLTPRRWEYDAVHPWPAAVEANLLGGSDNALALGGSLRRGVNYLCATADGRQEIRDEILLYGPDLREIQGEAPYGRITIIKLHGDTLDERQTFNAILDTDVLKHRVAPQGFAVDYAEGARFEIVRVSREALKQGISLANIGASYIERYRTAPHVAAVTEIFITDPAYDFAAAEALGARTQKTMIALRAHSTLPRRPELKK